MKSILKDSTSSAATMAKVMSDLSALLVLSKVFPRPAKDIVYVEPGSNKDTKLSNYHERKQ